MGIGAAVLAGAIIGGASAGFQSYESNKAAKKQAEIQKEANEKMAKLNAGQAVAETKENALKLDKDMAVKGLQQTLLSRTNTNPTARTKFGDLG